MLIVTTSNNKSGLAEDRTPLLSMEQMQWKMYTDLYLVFEDEDY